MVASRKNIGSSDIYGELSFKEGKKLNSKFYFDGQKLLNSMIVAVKRRNVKLKNFRSYASDNCT